MCVIVNKRSFEHFMCLDSTDALSSSYYMIFFLCVRAERGVSLTVHISAGFSEPAVSLTLLMPVFKICLYYSNDATFSEQFLFNSSCWF